MARVNAATLAELASAPAPPRNVRLQTKELQNDSTLEWDAPEDGRPSGYIILWRATTAPDWEHSQLVGKDGKDLKATLPLSKDNVIFAVQSVDDAGHRSLPVVPVPEP